MRFLIHMKYLLLYNDQFKKIFLAKKLNYKSFYVFHFMHPWNSSYLTSISDS